MGTKFEIGKSYLATTVETLERSNGVPVREARIEVEDLFKNSVQGDFIFELDDREDHFLFFIEQISMDGDNEYLSFEDDEGILWKVFSQEVPHRERKVLYYKSGYHYPCSHFADELREDYLILTPVRRVDQEMTYLYEDLLNHVSEIKKTHVSSRGQFEELDIMGEYVMVPSKDFVGSWSFPMSSKRYRQLIEKYSK